MKIGTKKEEIYNLLLDEESFRDNDNFLIAVIWKDEIANLWEKTALDLLELIANDGLTSPESIRRTRQKIQQENPSLRGDKYNLRHKGQIEVKQELKDWNNEQN
tara:strand:- start:2387 stop:2698 length:312 start_codon:yes stop_codon:yes gene_type:complete